MKRLEFMRRSQGLTQRGLSSICRVAQSDICRAECGRVILYPGQLDRLADALGWEGDPAALVGEVQEDALISD